MKRILSDKLDFSALRLTRDSSTRDQMKLDGQPIEVIFEANGINPDSARPRYRVASSAGY